MTNQTHKVATDALETLGMLIPENSGRDAIHLAVEPVVAGEHLYPSQRIKLVDGKAVSANTIADAIGIVDPFLSIPVMPDQRFWLVVLPRTITSLRHVWSHPAFPEERPFHADADEHYVDPQAASKAWIEAFAASIEQTYNRLMAAADEWVESREYTYDNSESYKGNWDGFTEFWDHWERVTGRTGPDREGHDRSSFFTCSC